MSRRFERKILTSLAAIVIAVLTIGPAAQAATPAPGYERFAGCPSQVEQPQVVECLYSIIKSGHFEMGSKKVPITNPITMTGGLDNTLGGFVANSEGGLKPVKQQVPGGVIGLTGLDWLVNFLSVEGLKLYAVTELVGQPQVGDTLKLPIRVHLINPVLGSKCYVGSASNPVVLNLTSGTTDPPPPNSPISGVPPKFTANPETGLLSFKDGVYVDNSFAAPGANGCTLTLFGFIPVSINGLVNTSSGLPAPAGTNETVQAIDIELAPEPVVYP